MITDATRQMKADLRLSKIKARRELAEMGTPPTMTRSEVDAAVHAERVQAEYLRLRARREAQRRVDAEEHPPVAPPEIVTLQEHLARNDAPPRWRIAELQPEASRVMLAAQFKAGKTTISGNLIRSLVDGDPFLGRYPVTPVKGTVALVDVEMGSRQLAAWLRAQQIQHADRVVVISLRGSAGAFDLRDETIRAGWVERLREQKVEYVIVDCLRPILDSLGLDEHREAGAFLVELDRLLVEASIPDATVIHHMGHHGERSRGDSRLRDWPDVEWRLVRQDDDPASDRYLAAYGRDVDVPESRLIYDCDTRRLTIADGSRADLKTRAALDAVVDVLAKADGPQTGRQIKAALVDSDHSRNTIDDALRRGIRDEILAVDPGPRGAKLYRVAASVPVSRSVPTALRDGGSECPNSLTGRWE